MSIPGEENNMRKVLNSLLSRANEIQDTVNHALLWPADAGKTPYIGYTTYKR